MTTAGVAAWLRPRLGFAWVLGGVVWAAWLVSLAHGGWTRDAVGQLFAPDHIAFYTAARLVGEGRESHLYDFAFVQEYQKELTGGDWPHVMGYRNPPFYALLYLPTSNLPLFASALVWMGVSLGAVALAVRLVGGSWSTVGWAVTFYPLFAAVSFGQNTPLSMLLFAAAYRLLNLDRPFAAGLVAGLLWYKPQLLIGLFVWWGLTPRCHWRCWLGLAVTGAVLAALSWLALPDGSRAFAESLSANVGYGGHGRWNEHSPRAFWELLIPNTPAVTWPLTLLCSLLGVLWLASVRPTLRTAGLTEASHKNSHTDRGFPLAVFLSLWASPHVLVYEWALLVLPAVVLWSRFPDRRDTWLGLFALAWAVLAVSTPLAKVQLERLSTAVQVSVPVLGFVGWATARALRSAREPAVSAGAGGGAT
jgi:hypothetical protein